VKKVKVQKQIKHVPGKESIKNHAIDSYTAINRWFDKHNKKWPFIIGGLCVLYTLLLFNAKISEANDDALYIEAAYNYSKNFTTYFFTANAPLYPMLLSIPVSLFGLNLIALKLFSVMFNFLSVIVFYKGFKNRLPNMIFYAVIFIISINSLMLFYASMTYSESFFMFLQACFFYSFFKLYDKLDAGETSLKQNYKQWLLLGFIMVVLAFSRSIAIVALPAVALVFLFQKQYLNSLLAIVSFLIFKIPLELIKAAIWGNLSQFSAQSKILLLKNPYDASQGNEDVYGFFMRLIDNSNIYLSKRFFQIIGFMDESSRTISGLITLVVYAFLVLGGIQMIRNKNQKLLIIPVYCFAVMITSFIALQARWDQARIIMVCLPLMLIIIFYGLYQLLRKSSFRQNIFFTILLVVCSSVLISSTKKGITNFPVVSKNLEGDIYYGYTPDWINFFKASEWCGANLPPTSKVASRKAPMSFIYGKGVEFFPVYKVLFKDPKTNQSNPDSVLDMFKKNGVTHFLLSSLRMNPDKNNGRIINTMNNVIEPIANKYPEKLKLVKQIGEYEPTYIYEINY